MVQSYYLMPHVNVLENLTLALRAREISAVELLDRVLDRADEVTDSVNPCSVRLDAHAPWRGKPTGCSTGAREPAHRAAGVRQRLAGWRAWSSPMGR